MELNPTLTQQNDMNMQPFDLNQLQQVQPNGGFMPMQQNVQMYYFIPQNQPNLMIQQNPDPNIMQQTPMMVAPPPPQTILTEQQNPMDIRNFYFPSF